MATEQVDLLKMARNIRDGDDPASALWVMVQMFDRAAIEKHVKHAGLMVQIGMTMPSPSDALATFIGVATGRIKDDQPPPPGTE